MIVLAALIGVIESIMARLRLLHVPQLLVGAGVIAVIGLILILEVMDMQQWLELATVLLFLTNLAMLGLSELGACVRMVAIQGILLGLFTLIVREDVLTAAPDFSRRCEHRA